MFNALARWIERRAPARNAAPENVGDFVDMLIMHYDHKAAEYRLAACQLEEQAIDAEHRAAALRTIRDVTDD